MIHQCLTIQAADLLHVSLSVRSLDVRVSLLVLRMRLELAMLLNKPLARLASRPPSEGCACAKAFSLKFLLYSLCFFSGLFFVLFGFFLVCVFFFSFFLFSLSFSYGSI